MKTILQLSIFLLLFPPCSHALMPSEVVVVANSRMEESVRLASYYMHARAIPKANLLIIQAPVRESCERNEYLEDIQKPIRAKITALQREQRIRAIVLLYGIPLKIQAHGPLSSSEKKEVKKLEGQIRALKRKKQSASEAEQEQFDQQMQQSRLQINLLKRTDTRAAVDSELALVLADDYTLDSWQPNPYFLGFQRKEHLIPKDKVLIVSRIDGPDPGVVRRVIDDSIAAEKKGIQGRAYFDARWKKPIKKKLQGYQLYDNSIHAAAHQLDRTGRLPVTLDQQDSLFQKGDCPEAAIYCGWYSLANYVDAFEWVQGSIGYHIASSECTTLRKKNSNVWCKRMLENGIAATIGPVYEPYVQGFPLPEIFFRKLTEGYLSLGETYLISLPYLSWQMVLVGDPLYQPFTPMDAPGSGNDTQ